MDSTPPASLRNRTLLLLLIVAIAPSVGTLSALWLWPGVVGGTIYTLCKVVLYGVPAIVAWRTLDRTAVVEGLKRGLKTGPIVFAIASGVVIGGVILLAWNVLLQGTLDVGGLLGVAEESGLQDPAQYLLLAVWFCTGNALLEEFVFRWFVDSRLGIMRVPGVIAVPLSGLIFTAHHILVLAAYFSPGATAIFSLGVFIGGVTWSWSFRRWRSLVPGWISHALVDGAVFLVGWQILFG